MLVPLARVLSSCRRPLPRGSPRTAKLLERPVSTCCLPSSPPFPLQPTASCTLCSVERLSLSRGQWPGTSRELRGLRLCLPAYLSALPRGPSLGLHRLGVPMARPGPVSPGLCPPQANLGLKLVWGPPPRPVASPVIAHPHEPPPSTENQTSGLAPPWSDRLKNWTEEAEEPPEDHRPGPRPPSDGHLASPACPVLCFLVWAEAVAWNPLWEGTSDAAPAPCPCKTPPQPRGRPAHIPTGQAGPKDSGPGCPLRGGAGPPRPPPQWPPPFDRWTSLTQGPDTQAWPCPPHQH
ncbi:uncharacterized protein LOC129066206 isoform X3 [Pteronotus mesoamericanus]|uniref:uncharacterized protein LOC129066206 isoform X3 n=1 Tax=Pteronotus mesoamericanus TaxID=1884717 RepID=UPI0023EBA1C0|nr:uncharacterized protein LOC129066206 isoform X3 [Pteronotus parnellii mesoamericanus]